MNDLSELKRPTRQNPQNALLDVEPDWRSEWWGMPEFDAGNASPQRSLTIHFVTDNDCAEFCKAAGIVITAETKSLYYPQQKHLTPGLFAWHGTPSPTRYPVYVPSKGRAQLETTGQLLTQAGIDFRFVVEETEADQYISRYPGNVLVLPFHDMGQGSIPARNWIWDYAQNAGARWHWIIDDNVSEFARTHANRRLQVKNSSAPLRIVEDMVDRYDNIAFAGLCAKGFCNDRAQISPYTLNTRVYSVTLINTSLPYRWRGRYNEDTDICLRALKDGWATVLFRALTMHKAGIGLGVAGTGMPGGNTDNVYNTDDHRRAFAESLREQHPDVVKVVWKFGRWHHQVDYSPFKRNALQLKAGIVPTVGSNEYGMRLVRTQGEGQIE